ncbi:hypothetical protein ABIB06_001861 [Bradyrhizobium sp. LB8.2]|uniref:hypothetical protein n=1 Tax=unclassified Bradyrhizobium TaxID=2631580 RepID=UPI0033909424
MAKPTKPTGTSRIKFIMFDAEIADDQIQSVTQAITNALRGPAGAPVVRRLPASTPANGHSEPAEVEVLDEVEDELDTVDVTPTAPRQKTVRKVKAPDIVEIEMHAPVSFADFAKGKDDGSQHKKFMIAAAWLAEHRSTPIVTDGHIYTCFRSIGWSTAINDFGQPLRELKGRKFFTTPERGHYEINHIGLDYVNKKLVNDAE